MRWPFLKDVCAYELVDYSLVNGTIGVAASMVAMLGGGWIIARHGLRRWLLPFMIAQNGLNWLFFGLATLAEPSDVSRFAIAAVLTADNFASGLGTAAFSVYMMRCARPEYRGGHMAIITSIMSVGWAVAGSASGVLAQSMGFANYFAMSFLVTVPSMVLALFVPHLEEKAGAGQAA
jgi:PAT family beta-lactamase induction signal transducer AmpG